MSALVSKGSRDWTDEVEEDDDDVAIQSNENKSTHQGNTHQREQHSQQHNRNQRDNRGGRNHSSGYQRRNDHRDGGGRGGGDRGRRNRPPFLAYVSNLNYVVTEDDIGTFFVGGGCKVKDVTLNRENGKSRGSAIVEFHDEESLLESLSANDYMFKERPIKVEIDGSQSRSRDDGQRNSYHSRQPADNRHNKQNYSNNNPNEKPRERGAPSADAAPSNPESPSSTNRPKLELKPRTLPVEKIGEPIANSDIFGGAKPNDLLAYEAEKKKKEAEEEAQKPKEEKKIDELVEDLSLKEKQASDPPSTVEKDGKHIKGNKTNSSTNSSSNSHTGAPQEGKGINRPGSRGGEKPRKPRSNSGDVSGDRPKPKKIEDGPPKREREIRGDRERTSEGVARNDKGKPTDNRKKHSDNPKPAMGKSDHNSNKGGDSKAKKVKSLVILISLF